MRGKILQYNGNDGSGVIVADGQQYAFNISLWKGNIAPAVGKTVDVVMKDGLIQSTIPVADVLECQLTLANLDGARSGSERHRQRTALRGQIIADARQRLRNFYELFLCFRRAVVAKCDHGAARNRCRLYA